jgi:hypothetical protein
MMRNMQFSFVDDDGLNVFVPTAEGRRLIAEGRTSEVVCPTGNTCKHACACSGVSASGVVGVGASCKCISLVRPPNPPAPGQLGFAASTGALGAAASSSSSSPAMRTVVVAGLTGLLIWYALRRGWV